jgi:hypothetical protein
MPTRHLGIGKISHQLAAQEPVEQMKDFGSGQRSHRDFAYRDAGFLPQKVEY